ncbi:MAG TPA: hypothetical protein VJK03_02880 [Candidatus Nanoarchaeia archaeon]|nr:hypothetical protein [Candidatus Nanoarchaeia archaeon]
MKRFLFTGLVFFILLPLVLADSPDSNNPTPPSDAVPPSFYTSDDRATCLATPSLRCYTGTWVYSLPHIAFGCTPAFYAETNLAGSSLCARCLATPKSGRICDNPQKFVTGDTNQAACEFQSPSRCYTGKWIEPETATAWSSCPDAPDQHCWNCKDTTTGVITYKSACTPAYCEGTTKPAGTTCGVAGTPRSPGNGANPTSLSAVSSLPDHFFDSRLGAFDLRPLARWYDPYAYRQYFGARWGEYQDRGQCGYDPVSLLDNGMCYRDTCTDDFDQDGAVACVGDVQSRQGDYNTFVTVYGQNSPIEPLRAANQHYESGNYIADCDDSNANYQTDKKLSLNELTAGAPAFDPAYVNKTIVERHFDPRKTGKFTPFDQLVIPLSYTAHEHCPTKWDPSGLNVSIVAGDEVIATVNYGSSFALYLSHSNTDYFGNVYPSEGYYRTNATQEPYNLHLDLIGITLNYTLTERIFESIIKKVSEGKAIKIRLEQMNSYTNALEMKEITLPMTNCRQLYGEGEQSFVFAYAKSFPFNLDSMAFNAAEVLFGLLNLDPFKTYNASLSYFIDLHKYDDSSWTLDNRTHASFSNNYYFQIPRDSSCQGKKKYFFYHNHSDVHRAYTQLDAPTMFLNPLRSDLSSSLHENGHAFCGLMDEYPNNGAYEPGLLDSFTNCAYRLESYTYAGKIYSQGWSGCFYSGEPQGNTAKGTNINIKYYRPSETSLMHGGPIREKFNVVSCGYCLSKIKGGSAKSNFPECNDSLDTIKPPA